MSCSGSGPGSAADDLLSDILISSFRVVAGWALSALVAMPLGLLIGNFRVMQATPRTADGLCALYARGCLRALGHALGRHR